MCESVTSTTPTLVIIPIDLPLTIPPLLPLLRRILLKTSRLNLLTYLQWTTLCVKSSFSHKRQPLSFNFVSNLYWLKFQNETLEVYLLKSFVTIIHQTLRTLRPKPSILLLVLILTVTTKKFTSLTNVSDSLWLQITTCLVLPGRVPDFYSSVSSSFRTRVPRFSSSLSSFPSFNSHGKNSMYFFKNLY